MDVLLFISLWWMGVGLLALTLQGSTLNEVFVIFACAIALFGLWIGGARVMWK